MVTPKIMFLALTTFWFLDATYAQTIPSNTDESKIPPYTLPDPLVMPNGKRVKSAAEWNAVQRPYIYHLFEQYQFGRYPGIKPVIHFKVLEADSHVFNGTATRKQIRIFLVPADTAVFMDLLVYLPNLAQRVPVFAGYNFFGNQSVQDDRGILISRSWMPAKAKGVLNNRATENSRGTDSSQWPVEEILKRGFGVVTAYYGDVEPDQPDGWRSGIRTTMSQVLKIKPGEWSAMGAWAFGLSCMMDYLQKDQAIDAGRVALIGHSRLGKAALWAGASDRRFALLVSNESGEGGATLSKRWYGETIKIINQKFPYWFSPNYRSFGDNTAALPMDGHMLLSLIAPRPLYVASAEGDQWSDPKGEFLSAKEASRVYSLFKRPGIDVDSMPPLHHPVGHTVRYHIRAGKHDVKWYDWQQYLQFASEQFNVSRPLD